MRSPRPTPGRLLRPRRARSLTYAEGQRWQSLTEPELGLGVLERVDGREIVIRYPARGVTRTYAVESAPLARARLSEGQEAAGGGVRFRIEEVVEGDVLTYRGGGHELAETDLDAALDVATPENRLRTGQVDEFALFDLRHDALDVRHRMLSSPARGFLGGRIRLFDHQLSIARDVCERHRVRVLLADEVGLGKTIEALLVLHRLSLTDRVERALVLVPPALVHQWLAEAYLRFNLVLRVVGRETFGFDEPDVDEDDLPTELLGAQLFVAPLDDRTEAAVAEADWDLLIVDEAHHLEPESAEFALVERLAEEVEHVVLLSATPDRDGEEAHFRRLQLLDPVRFDDPEEYRREAEHYRELADTAERLHDGAALEEEDRVALANLLHADDVGALVAAADGGDGGARRTLLARLLDLHGVGRVMFRNVRARIEGFPRRVLRAVDLEGGRADRMRREFLHDLGRDASYRLSRVEADPRTDWLKRFLADHADEKVVVMCTSREKVEAFADAIETKKRPVARFHERMSNLERDRQAAWFLAPDGPQLLISAAIGGEGRNFQVARHLVLLDLPPTADRLEQWIGRVDRIGQAAEVEIHVPAVPGTPQARLRRWFDEALRVFETPWHGTPAIDREFGDALVEALLADGEDRIAAVVARGRERNAQILDELEHGRDRLLELTSFDGEAATALREAIDQTEEGPELEQFMLDAFERAGIEAEWIGDRSYTLRTGPSYRRPFPGFHGQEMAVTFDRETGLTHPERVLLGFDHPMVRDTLDDLLAHEAGNAAVVRLDDDRAGWSLEAIYVVEPTVDRELRADRFFPPTPIRVVVDASGDEASIDAERVRREATEIDARVLTLPDVARRIPALVEAARELAERRAPAIADAARARMRDELAPLVDRLTELTAVHPSVAPELEAARAERRALDDGLARHRIRLEGLRLIVLAPRP
ncbi:MAG: RNA polymerase-associated protein RapA [Planctomycetota bacterium JB042]